MPLLPRIQSSEEYKTLFKNSQNWDEAIKFIQEKHGLVGTATRGALGSHIVYHVGSTWIKLMAPLFRGDMIYEIEGLKAVQGQLSADSPHILAEGEIEGWPYILLSHVQGESIRYVWSELNQKEKNILAKQMAQICREIHRCQSGDIIRNRFDWNQFIHDQYLNCEARHSKRGMSGRWIQNLKSFLHSFEMSEFQTLEPRLVHADLTYDHFLVSQSSDYHISGILDLADCQVGHFEYELMVPATFSLRKEKEALRAFYQSAGIDLKQLNHRFSEKILAWALQHRYCDFNIIFQSGIEIVPEGDFSALAQCFYPLE